MNQEDLRKKIEEREALRNEVKVTREAAEFTAKLVVEQFVRIDEILQRLQVRLRESQQLADER